MNKTNKYLKKLIHECINELLLEADIDSVPLLPDSFIAPNGEVVKFSQNKKVADAQYSGITPEIAEKIHRLCIHIMNAFKPEYQQFLEEVYLYIVGRNPDLKSIPLTIAGYDNSRSPMFDIVYGVASGIPIEDLIYFIMDVKGDGKKAPKQSKLSGYIKYTKNI